MKGMPGIAGVKAEEDLKNEFSGKSQKVMKVKPKDEFSTVASRKRIRDKTVVAQGADQADLDSEKAYEESKKSSFKMKNSATEILTGLAGNTMMEAAKDTPLEKKGKKYGDRSRKEMRQDISKERKSLKAGGATREEVKAFNRYQRTRKGEIASAAKAAKDA